MVMSDIVVVRLLLEPHNEFLKQREDERTVNIK